MEDKKKESETPKGYYSNAPRIGNNGPSRLRREISKGMTFFVVNCSEYCILLCTVEADQYIWCIQQSIGCAEADSVRIINCIFAESDREADG